jgi:hypothetical protein
VKKYSNKEKHARQITVAFHQREHYNALRDEPWCPKEVYTEPACTREMIVFCETENEALSIAKYHFYSTGSDFKIKDNQPNQ